MKHKAKRKPRHRALKLVAIPAVVGASLTGGFAAAVFTMSGSVEADGRVATPTSPTASAKIASLWPGDCAEVSVTFTNDNEHAVVIDGITGSITKQPDTGDRNSRDRGTSNDPVVWRGSSDALQGRAIPASGSATFTIPDAVCLSAKVTDQIQGDEVTASVTFGFHLAAGTEYQG